MCGWVGLGVDWVDGGFDNVHMCIIPKREDERDEDERQKRGADTLLTRLHFH